MGGKENGKNVDPGFVRLTKEACGGGLPGSVFKILRGSEEEGGVGGAPRMCREVNLQGSKKGGTWRGREGEKALLLLAASIRGEVGYQWKGKERCKEGSQTQIQI